MKKSLTIGILLLFIIGGIGAYFVFAGNDKAKEPKTVQQQKQEKPQENNQPKEEAIADPLAVYPEAKQAVEKVEALPEEGLKPWKNRDQQAAYGEFYLANSELIDWLEANVLYIEMELGNTANGTLTKEELTRLAKPKLDEYESKIQAFLNLPYNGAEAEFVEQYKQNQASIYQAYHEINVARYQALLEGDVDLFAALSKDGVRAISKKQDALNAFENNPTE